MKLQPYFEKLNNSIEYKDFHKKNNDAFVIAGFFVLDLEMGNNIHQIDYYVPSKKKIAAFTLDKRVTIQLLDMLNEKVPEKLDIKAKTDLDQLQGILEDEMKNRGITEEIKKIIAVLQNIKGKRIWNLNCVLSGMGILSAHIEDESKTVLKMEKKSLIDIMKKMPASEFKQQVSQEKEGDVKEKLNKLDELAKEIEKEKDELVKTSAESSGVKGKENKAQLIQKKVDSALAVPSSAEVSINPSAKPSKLVKKGKKK